MEGPHGQILCTWQEASLSTQGFANAPSGPGWRWHLLGLQIRYLELQSPYTRFPNVWDCMDQEGLVWLILKTGKSQEVWIPAAPKLISTQIWGGGWRRSESGSSPSLLWEEWGLFSQWLALMPAPPDTWQKTPSHHCLYEQQQRLCNLARPRMLMFATKLSKLHSTSLRKAKKLTLSNKKMPNIKLSSVVSGRELDRLLHSGEGALDAWTYCWQTASAGIKEVGKKKKVSLWVSCKCNAGIMFMSIDSELILNPLVR